MDNQATPRRRNYSIEWLFISLLLVASSLFLDYTGSLWRWDQLLYDSQVKIWKRSAPDDIVIVAIDSRSLSAIGRWPWSRSVHAELVNRLTDAGAKAILFDVLFAEPNLQDPEGDQKMADAVGNSGRVFLPIIIELLDSSGEFHETMPISPLAQGAVAVGHVDIDLDQDGIARRVYLKEGIGDSYWFSLAVAILRHLEPDQFSVLPGTRNPALKPYSSQNIVRDNHILLPFAGPPGHFQRLPFIDVIEGNYGADAFQDKIVLVGATATGLGDYYPTPVSGHSQPMPGVEINANLVDTLRRGIAIEAMDLQQRMPISALILLSTLLLFPRLQPKYGLPTVAATFLFILVLSAILLHGFRIWFAPTSILIGLLLGYPLWSWRRLENAVRYFDQELGRLNAEPKGLSFYGESMEISQGLEFLRHIASIDGWRVLDQTGRVLVNEGRAPTSNPSRRDEEGYVQKEDEIWVSILRDQGVWQIGVALDKSKKVLPNGNQLIVEFLQQFRSELPRKHRGGYELVESQIQKVQSAISNLRNMRSLLSDTLTQMVDGLLVVNLGGQVVMANVQATKLLGVSAETKLLEGKVDMLMEELSVSNKLDWNDIFSRVLIGGEIVRLEGRLPPEKDVLIQVSPMSVTQGRYHGMMFVLSDISLVKQFEYKRARALRFLSHDLRSPISSVLSLVEMQKQNSKYFTVEEMSDRIEHYANRALHLADDFLRLVKAESVNEADFEDTDFVTIVHNAADEVYAQAKKSGIRIKRKFELEEAWIKADPDLVERALKNLIENAIRYSPEGSSVELEVKEDGNSIVCCVKDKGRGIAEVDLQRIFEPFRQVPTAGSNGEGGAGLGLAIVKAVAETHHGSVTVKSQYGNGSRFCFRVPYSAEPLGM